MAMITVRIGTLAAPPGTDVTTLHEDIARELRTLLEREPVGRLPEQIALPGGRVHAASDASLAYAVARHVHNELRAQR
jgi:hypothetical protein